MATRITKAGPRRIVFSPGAGDVNTAMPPRAHPVHPVGPEPLKPKVGKPGTPNPTPVFPVHGHFTTNDQGNIVRISSGGRTPVRPYTGQHHGFQGASTPSGNPKVYWRPSVESEQQAADVKIAGSPILAKRALVGNDKRRGAQPVNTVMAFSRATQNGGQAYLPGYKRKKFGRQG